MAVLYPSAGLRAADSSYFGRMTDLQSLEAGLGQKICGNKRPAAAMGAGYNGGWGSGSGGSIADQISAGGRPANWQSSCAVLTSQWAALSAKETQIPTTKTTSSTSTTSTTTSSSHTLSEKEAVLSENETITMSLQKDRSESHHAMFRETFKDLVMLPKPLSISDLSNPPSHGSTLRVAYQGVPGAYSEAAAGKAYPKCEAIPCEQFEAAFQAVELWIADRAVLPIENSLGGSIHRNYDLLLRHRLHIVGEVQFAVHHCLLGLPGVKKEDLKRVISHPQALSQCEHTLAKLGVAREAVDDTAGAAQFVAMNQLRDTGAVASAKAAEIYGLEILADGIQDDTSNVTRFLMLAREPIIPRTDRKFKTSIVFALEEEPGALFRALSAFALRNINLTKIESRPQRKRPLRVVDDSNHGTAKYFEYLFYIDFEASMADPRAQNALGQIQEFASFLRVLGCYPMDMTPVLTGSGSSSSSNSE